MVKHGAQVICFFPSKGHPLALRVATATEIESEEIDTEGKNCRCVRSSFSLVSSISMHVDDTRSRNTLFKVSLSEVAAMQAFLFGILDDKIVLDTLDSAKGMCQTHSSIIGVRAPGRANDHTQEKIVVHF